MLKMDRGQNEVLIGVYLYKLRFRGRAAALTESLEQRGIFGIRRDAFKRRQKRRITVFYPKFHCELTLSNATGAEQNVLRETIVCTALLH